MKVLILGQTGQVARALIRRAEAGMTVTASGRDKVDLADRAACTAAILASDADVVINAAAFTAVDLAESAGPGLGRINADAPGAMAAACARRGVPFIQLSTDYVFEGAGDQPRLPTDEPAPINAYGNSKLAGERQVRAAGGNSLILRTSWVFSTEGSNFVKTILRLGRERDSLNVVADQVGGPTPANDLADAMLTAARAMHLGKPGGIHHLAGAPDTTWADFARAILAGAGLECRIIDITSSDYPAAARRPKNSRLDCTSFEEQFGVSRPDWRAGLKMVLVELGAQQ